MEQAFYTMLYLAFTQIKDVRVNKLLIKDVDLELLYKCSEFHKLTAIVCDGLEAAKVFENVGKDNNKSQSVEDNEANALLVWYKKFKEAKEKSVRKNVLMDVERGRLFSYMKEKGIWYMPLKGVVLKELYPKVGQRQMADNDILFDSVYQKEVHDWFVSQGYDVIHYNKGHHDVYEKKPIYNFEMHTMLYYGLYQPEWAEYYENIKNRLIENEKKTFEFHFFKEDFYIYFFSHTYKHFNASGTGVRFLPDMYLYLEQNQKKMDWQYIQDEMKKLGIAEFEKDSKELVRIISETVDKADKEEKKSLNIVDLFEEKMDENKKATLDYLFKSGSYGTLENAIKRELEQYNGGAFRKKVKYIAKRLFPSREHMKFYGSAFGKYKLLLPIGWLWRIIRGVLHIPKKILKELKLLLRCN